ncbi:hypothetical protein [Herbiconiux sp. YIM B11900]|uniref:hypothetical protein n=1 Tax=Herbiconiux sp. YIM B11900 TaxID=3404131 RepID=UPI003F84A811
MTAGELVSSIIGVLGLLGGAIGFFVARTASKNADIAKRDAAAALTRSADADERVAVVLERLAAPPEPAAFFEVGRSADRTTGWIKNLGTVAARSLTVAGYPEPVKNLVSTGVPVELPPGQTLTFGISERLTLPVNQVHVVWVDDRDEMPTSATYWLP